MIGGGLLSASGPTAEGAGFDPVLHEPARLRAMTMLCALEEDDQMTLRRLHELLEVPEQDLRDALAPLVEAGCVVMGTGKHGATAGTWLGATVGGRTRFRSYVATLRTQLVAARSSPCG